MASGDLVVAAGRLDRAWTMLESTAALATSIAPQSAAQLRQARTFQWVVGSPQNNRALSGWNLWFLGYPDRALERISIATAIAQSGSKTMLADIHGYATYINDLRRELE